MNCLQNTRLQQLLTSDLCAISFGMKSRYKKFTLCTKLYFYLKCLYFPYHHLYTNIQISKMSTSWYCSCITVNVVNVHFCQRSWTPDLVWPNFSFCGLGAYHSTSYLHVHISNICLVSVFVQKIHKLYFPYHHLYTNIQISKWLLFAYDYYAQNSNCLHNDKLYFTFHIIICTQISKMSTSCHCSCITVNVHFCQCSWTPDLVWPNLGFCGLCAYHSFCTKNSQTLLSISSFVHKYPNIQMVAICTQLLCTEQ